MKTLFVVLLIAGLVFSCIPSFAGTGVPNRFNDRQVIKSITFVNDADTSKLSRLASIAKDSWYEGCEKFVVTTNRLLGYSVASTGTDFSGTAHSAYFAWYDQTDTGDTKVTALEAEVETSSTQASVTEWYAYPKEVKNGIVLLLGPRTCVTLYYEDHPAGY